MSTTRKPRLGPLPDTQTVKLTFSCAARLSADLDHYAPCADPHMLDAFVAKDWAFKRLAS
jgi:hypothetical protein